jgi:hypothetical protein
MVPTTTMLKLQKLTANKEVRQTEGGIRRKRAPEMSPRKHAPYRWSKDCVQVQGLEVRS